MIPMALERICRNSVIFLPADDLKTHYLFFANLNMCCSSADFTSHRLADGAADAASDFAGEIMFPSHSCFDKSCLDPLDKILSRVLLCPLTDPIDENLAHNAAFLSRTADDPIRNINRAYYASSPRIDRARRRPSPRRRGRALLPRRVRRTRPRTGPPNPPRFPRRGRQREFSHTVDDDVTACSFANHTSP